MKVLFFTLWYPQKDKPVLGTFVRELARAASLYDDIEVLHGYSVSGISRLYMISEKREGDIRVICVKYKRFPVVWYLVYLFSMIQVFRKVKKDFTPDVIHAHIYKASFIAVILGKLYRIPIVVTEHAEIVDIYRPGIFQKIKNSLSVVLARFALNNCDLLILVSKSLQERLESIGIKNKVKIVPNIVDTKTFYPGNKREDNQKKKLLFVGGLTPVKGISYLIEAISRVRESRTDFVLDLVGDGSHRSEYERLAKKLGVSDVIKFHGLKNKDEVAEFMRNCDFFILPSLYETFGVVLIEAMACGKPVISTLSGGQKEFVNEKNGILVPSKDTRALAKSIRYLLDHQHEYDAEELVKYVRERFSYERVGKSLHEIYQNL